MSAADRPPEPVEGIKARSRGLRGTLAEGLADAASGALADDDTQLSKFHGIYQQDDRDQREERRRRMLEPAHSFMIRARVPGGVCTTAQWLAMDALARGHANGTLRLTTRQAFQLHGVLKGDLKPTIRAINDALLDTIAACGDVNRNVMCTPLPERSAVHRAVFAAAASLSRHLTPATRAYHELWLDGERVGGTEGDGRHEGRRAAGDEEPLYGPTYLPRKFKTAFVIPPRNDVDVLAHDLGFVAIVEDGRLAGFDVTVGGGMGATHGDPATFPRLADTLGFCAPEDVNEVAAAIVAIQRDHGDRRNRRHARFKYTVADRGLAWLHDELAARLGRRLAPPRPFRFTTSGDAYGWRRTDDGEWHLTLYVENGRLADRDGAPLLTGLRRIAEAHDGEFRITPNQNLVVARVREANRAAIDRIVAAHGLDGYRRFTPARLNAMACVALPTCALAMAEAERYLPGLVGHIEARLAAHGLAEQPVTIRMTGCPNGCARPYLAEIGLVGKAPGRYNLMLGAAFDGTRLNRLALENADEAEILEALDALFADYAGARVPGEPLGDFVERRWPREAKEQAPWAKAR